MQPQRWSSREELVLQVTTLARQGIAVRAIARATGVARNTVKAILATQAAALAKPHTALPERPARAPRQSAVTDPDALTTPRQEATPATLRAVQRE